VCQKLYLIEELDWNQYKCKKCQPAADHFEQRETIIADILKIVPRKEMARGSNKRRGRAN
jgi:hypothetical protein